MYVFRSGLAKGVPGENHLAWEVEITNGADVRELVYVNAHTGKIVDRISGIHDEMSRRAYDGRHLAAPPQNYPQGASWNGTFISFCPGYTSDDVTDVLEDIVDVLRRQDHVVGFNRGGREALPFKPECR